MRECRHGLGRARLSSSLACLGWGQYALSGVMVKVGDRVGDRVSGWVGLDLSRVVAHRHTDDLLDVRRWVLRRAETEMVRDPADRDGVGDVGNDLERATAAFADERIRLKDLGDEPRPAWEQRRFFSCSSSCGWRGRHRSGIRGGPSERIFGDEGEFALRPARGK